MNVRPLLSCFAAIVALFVPGLSIVPGAFAQDVRVTFEPAFVVPPDVASGDAFRIFGGSSVWFPTVADDGARAQIWWAVYIEADNIDLESVQLSLEWPQDDVTLFSANVEPSILFGPLGFLGRETNPLLDIANVESPVEAAFDFGLAPGLLPATSAKDLMALLVFDVSVAASAYTADESFVVNVGVLAAGDELVGAGGATPTFNGQVIGGPVETRSAVSIFVTADPAPEPTTATGLVSGAFAVAWLGRRRARGGARTRS